LVSEDSGVQKVSNSQSGSSFGSVKVHSLTLSYTPKRMRCDSHASLLACTLASPCLGREPKTRVATIWVVEKDKIYSCDLGFIITGLFINPCQNDHKLLEIKGNQRK